MEQNIFVLFGLLKTKISADLADDLRQYVGHPEKSVRENYLHD